MQGCLSIGHLPLQCLSGCWVLSGWLTLFAQEGTERVNAYTYAYMHVCFRTFRAIFTIVLLYARFTPFCLDFYYFIIKKASDSLSHFPSFDWGNLLRSLFSLIALFNCNFSYTLSHYCYFLIYCLLLLAARKCLSHGIFTYMQVYIFMYMQQSIKRLQFVVHKIYVSISTGSLPLLTSLWRN